MLLAKIRYDTARSASLACLPPTIFNSFTHVSAQVYVLDSRDLSVVGALTMPEGLNFQAEGGVSLHPDGSKLCAVSVVVYTDAQ